MEIANELMKLRGRWTPVYFESKSGKNDKVRDGLSVNDNARFVFGDTHGLAKGTIVIDPNAQPKSWDFRYEENGKTRIVRCIYKLNDDRLELYFYGEGTTRTSSFTDRGAKEEDFARFLFQREKPK
jgi:uncharacterized protein (TIGR03067 family)